MQFGRSSERIEAVSRSEGSGESQGTQYRHRLEAEPLWSVKDVARFLSVSEKTVRRMEARGEIQRCRHFVTLVRFRPRDVGGLASAPGKES